MKDGLGPLSYSFSGSNVTTFTARSSQFRCWCEFQVAIPVSDGKTERGTDTLLQSCGKLVIVSIQRVVETPQGRA